MKTFEQWLAEYTKEHGCPPAHVMAEAAWDYSHDQTRKYYTLGFCDDTVDDGMIDEYGYMAP